MTVLCSGVDTAEAAAQKAVVYHFILCTSNKDIINTQVWASFPGPSSNIPENLILFFPTPKCSRYIKPDWYLVQHTNHRFDTKWKGSLLPYKNSLLSSQMKKQGPSYREPKIYYSGAAGKGQQEREYVLDLDHNLGLMFLVQTLT